MARLCGTYKHTIDKKNRMFLPAKIRANIGDKFIAAKSLSAECIALYPIEVWEELFSAMEELTPDDKGRILIPAELCKYAGLEKDIVVIGVDDHAEIWSDVKRSEAEELENSPELLAQIAALGL